MWSLSPPLTSISKKGLTLESQHKAFKKCDACRGQDSLSGAGSEETQNKWQTIFSVVKSVAPSGMLRLYRKESVGPKITNWWNRVHLRENTCHLSSLRLVRSHKDLQGIYWKMCNELECRRCRANKKESIWSLFLKGETNIHETNAKTQKRTQENFI